MEHPSCLEELVARRTIQLEKDGAISITTIIRVTSIAMTDAYVYRCGNGDDGDEIDATRARRQIRRHGIDASENDHHCCEGRAKQYQGDRSGDDRQRQPSGCGTQPPPE